MKSLKSFVRPLAFAAATAVAFGACDEQINGGGACPALCPSPAVQLRDTTFFAISLDTTITGFPALGAERSFFLASMGDTLETAVVMRFDGLPNVFRRVNSVTDSVIMAVDSAYLRMTITTGDTLGLATTVDVYDVDMDGAEEADPTAVASAFTASRLVGTRTIPADSLRDSLVVPLDNAYILAKTQEADTARRRLRLGIKLREGGARELRMPSSFATVSFRPSTDVEVPRIDLPTFSRTPIDQPIFAADFADYQVILKGPPEPPPGTLRIGGLPPRRAYLLFDIPSSILDSSSVVRATLQMTQRPAVFSPEARDTVQIAHFGVMASPAVTDLSRALLLIDQLPTSRTTARLVPADSGLREFEIIGWVRVWRGTQASKTPRALALALPEAVEGASGSVVDFFSLEAAAAERPRLRLTYLPRTSAVAP